MTSKKKKEFREFVYIPVLFEIIASSQELLETLKKEIPDKVWMGLSSHGIDGSYSIKSKRQLIEEGHI